MKIHFVGIAGAGMHSLALYLSEAGHEVSGSDSHLTAERLAFWHRRGVNVFTEQCAENIGQADMVVYSAAIPRENPERKAAELRGIACSRGEALARFANAHPFSIAICGTHGKGTTAGAVSYVLSQSGRGVSDILGAVPIGREEPCVYVPESEFLVCEVDESDKTNCFHRPKLMLINNVEADHLNVYGDLESIVLTFERHVCAVLESGGRVLIHYSGVGAPLLYERLTDCRRIFWMAREGSLERPDLGYEIATPDMEGHCRLTVRDCGGDICRITPILCGRANAQNLVSAIGVAMQCGLDLRESASLLTHYRGLRHRCEVRQVGDYWLSSDYASHPTCVKNDIEWLRRRAKRVLAIYHPYRYSLMSCHWTELCEALNMADAVYLLPFDPCGEAEIPGISSQAMAAEMNRDVREKARAFGTHRAVFDAVAQDVCPGDLVVVFGGEKSFEAALTALECAYASRERG